MSHPKCWPVRVKSGNSTISIYRIRRKKNRRYYLEFKVAFYDELGKRRFQSFSNFKVARQAADNLNVGFRKGEVKSLLLSNDDKVVYLRALKALEPTGAALDLAAHQFTEAAKILGGVSLLEAARFYVKRNPVKLPRKSVQEVITEFLQSRAHRSEEYRRDLGYRLARFSEAFQTGIADVTRTDVVRFLSTLRSKKRADQQERALSPRSQLNYWKGLRVFFDFAKQQGYLPKDYDELNGIKIGDDDPGEIEIFTPKEMEALLSVAGPEIVPLLAIGGFAGLRSKEVERLDWSEVQLARGFIELKRSVTKTAQRRLVPIAPNLAQWLKPYAQESGHVWIYSSGHLTKAKGQTAAEAGIMWRHNALRHSFASYRLAQLQNASQVSLETGHSVKVLFSNYRELVTPEEAKAWFAILPEELGTVEIYRPEEMQGLLVAASAEVLPGLVLCGFSGLSVGEVEALDWAEVDLKRGVIQPREVQQGNGQGRQIPLLRNAAGCLSAQARSQGAIWAPEKGPLIQALQQLAQAAGIGWQGNGLRHSYAAYRLAQVRDVSQVARETGLSPHAIFTSFEERANWEDAQQWFSLETRYRDATEGLSSAHVMATR